MFFYDRIEVVWRDPFITSLNVMPRKESSRGLSETYEEKGLTKERDVSAIFF